MVFSDLTEQEASRSVRNETIIPYSEDSSNTTVFNDEIIVESSETTIPMWGGGPEKKPSKFDFDLSFSENMLVVDYGKKTVNTYRASYAPLVDDWGDEWFVYGYGVLADWCIGCDLSIYDDKRESTEFFIPDYNNSILNAQNVCLISLNEIDD